jgi:hypothetical protein
LVNKTKNSFQHSSAENVENLCVCENYEFSAGHYVDRTLNEKGKADYIQGELKKINIDNQ